MSSPVGFDAREQVRQAVDIVELVGSYIPLRRQGRQFVGICPWHDDARPSLQVNQERQSWKCWVCDLGGDIFSFVMRIEGLDFRPALEMLAERAGVTLTPLGTGQSGSAAPDGPANKRTLYAATQWAETQFHRCLLEAREAEPARRYLDERGISDESIRRFHLGFAPPRWDWLLTCAHNTDWSPRVLERVGLVKQRETGDGYYDSFRGRVMFSIRDARARPIAFGGRVLPQLADDRTAKYINSPETPLFSKSRELYAMDLARNAISKAQPPHVVVVEGYTDCIMAHQHGLQNVVAVLGTALGERHIPVLRRFTDSIKLVLDGDEAGRRRTNEILELFVAHHVDLQILTLPEGVDPCDLIATQGGDAFRHLLTQATDALEHKLAMVTKGLDLARDTHRASEAVEQVLATLARARPGAGMASSSTLLREQQLLSRIARQFQLPDDQLRVRLTALRQKLRRPAGRHGAHSQTPDPSRPHPTRTDFVPWERELLELVLLDASHLAALSEAIDPSTLATPLAQQIYQRAVELWRNGHTNLFERLMLESDENDFKQALVHLDEEAHRKADSDSGTRVTDLIAAQAGRIDDAQQRRDQLAASEDSTQADALFTQFINEARPHQASQYRKRKI